MSRIQNNIMAANTHRMYSKNNAAVSKSAEKLSSGYRINRAGDDAAGLAISEKMRAQIRGLNMASKNSNDAISLVQTAEGALQEAHTMLQRMNELAVQSASDTNVEIDRNALQLEFENLQDEIDQLAQTTKFNDTVLLDGTMAGGSAGAVGTASAAGNVAAFSFNVKGAAAGTKVLFAATAGSATDTPSVKASWTGNELKIELLSGSGAGTWTQTMVDDAIKAAKADAPSGAKEIKVELSAPIAKTVGGNATTTAPIVGGSVTVEAAASATVAAITEGGKNITVNSTVAGSEMNGKTLTFTTGATVGATKAANGNVTVNLETGKDYTAAELNNLLSQAGANMSVSFDGKINQSDLVDDGLGGTSVAHTLADGKGFADGGGIVIQVGAEEGHTLDLSIGAMNTTGLGITRAQANVASREAASVAISTSRNAINQISTQRATLGAMQNRLEYKISSLDITAENLQAAEGRIRDVDMAKEMTAFTKNNILTQAATAMLAQANAAPQNVLQLLG